MEDRTSQPTVAMRRQPLSCNPSRKPFGGRAGVSPKTLGLRTALAIWAALFAIPALPITVSNGSTVSIDKSGSLGSLTMDGGLLRLSAPSGAGGLTLSATDAVLGRGMIYNAYTQGSTTTLSLFGTTQLPGAPVGVPPADGMYLHGDYYDSSGLDVINKGTLNQTGTGEFTLLGRTRLINDLGAQFVIANDKGLKEFTGGSPNIVSFLNKGVFQKSGTSGISNISVRFDQEGGLVQLFSGVLSLGRGGTQNSAAFNADAGNTAHTGFIEFGGAHTFSNVETIAGAFRVVGGIAVAPGQTWLQEANVAATGAAAAIALGNASTMTNTGSLKLQNTNSNPAITLGALSTLNNSGSMQLQNASVVTIGSGAHLNNSGSLLQQGDSAIAIGAGGTLSNTGSLDQQGSGSITIAAGGTLRNSKDFQNANVAGGGALENQAGGTFQGNVVPASGAGGIPVGSLITVSNAGQFTVGGGNTVSVRQFDNSAGTLTVDGKLDVFGNGSLRLLGGTLNGNGVINGDTFVGGGPGAATFTPGHSPGSMRLNGDFSLLPGGVLQLEVAAVDGELEADAIILGAGANVLLSGHLSFVIGAGIDLFDVQFIDFFQCFDGCAITYGSSFSYDFVGRPGSQIELLDSGPRIVALGELGDIAPVPEPSVFVSLLAGVAAMSAVVRRRRHLRESAAA